MPRPLGEAQKKSRDLTEEQSEKFAKILEGLTGEVQGLGTSVIAELKSLREVLQSAMVEGSATDPPGIGPGEPCGMGFTTSESIPAFGFPPQMPHGPPGPPPLAPLPPPMASCSHVRQIPCPLSGAAPSSSPMAPVATTPQTPVTAGEASSAIQAQDCLFVGYSPKVAGEQPMTVALGGELPNRKPVPVLLKCNDKLLSASPTGRQGIPSRYTAAQAPIGWVVVPPSKDLRRVYNVFN